MLVCVAHPDDEVIGAGGTIAKLSRGEDVYSVLFSLGDKFPFWGDKSEVTRRRRSEYVKCEEILGIKKTFFFNYEDLRINEHFSEAVKKLTKIIMSVKPRLIFTHTITDGHVDHRAVNKITIEAVKNSFINTRVLTFGINFFNFHNGLSVTYDISDTFNIKMKALNVIHSQHLITAMLKPLILVKALYYGWRSGTKYAECFKSV